MRDKTPNPSLTAAARAEGTGAVGWAGKEKTPGKLRLGASSPCGSLTSRLPVKSELRHRNTPCQISESEDVRETTAANLYINWF